jgi:hypothetical protein
VIFANATIHWREVGPDTMPYAGTNVLLGLSTGHSCEGFFDGELWRDVTGWPIEGEDDDVVAWADLPACKAAAC